MLEATDYLWRASVLVGTIVACFTLGTDKGCPAFRTIGHIFHRSGSCLALVDIDTYNFGDYLTSLLDKQPVAFANAHFLNKVGIDHGGTFHRRSTKPHGFHVRHRCDHSRATYLIRYAQQWRRNLLRLEFVRYRPSRRFGRLAKLIP